MRVFQTVRCAGAVLAGLAAALAASSVLAEDWTVARLRGDVQMQMDGAWTALERGDAVPSGAEIRALAGGRAVLERGGESIDIASLTVFTLMDEGDALQTSILLAQGTVGIEADKQNFYHFSVQTAYLAAIVKGTRFAVTSGPGGASVVVERGLVQVQDLAHGVATDVAAGQMALVSDAEILAVSGPGRKRPMVDLDGVLVIVEPDGRIVTALAVDGSGTDEAKPPGVTLPIGPLGDGGTVLPPPPPPPPLQVNLPGDEDSDVDQPDDGDDGHGGDSGNDDGPGNSDGTPGGGNDNSHGNGNGQGHGSGNDD